MAPITATATATTAAATTTPAVSTSSAATTTTSVPAATAARRTLFPWAGLVNRQGAALKIFLMKHRNGFFGFRLRAHFHKCESAGPARRPILHNIDGNHRSRLGKVILKIIFRGIVREVSNK